MKKDTQLTVQNSQIVSQTQHENSFDLMIAKAIESGAAVEVIERLVAVREKLRLEWAEREYYSARATFQGECPVIEKKKVGGTTKQGIIAYRYAPFEDILTQVQPLLTKYGFSFDFNVKDKTDYGMTVICYLHHLAGFTREAEFPVPLGAGTSIMSEPQKVAAALTYGKRYAFCEVLGIATGDEDNDAQFTQRKEVSPQHRTPQKAFTTSIHELIVIAEQIGVTREALCKQANITNLEDLTEPQARALIENGKRHLEKIHSSLDDDDDIPF